VRLDGALVRAWAVAATGRLREVAPRIDALNVFPVADADTGTNVVHTLVGGAAGLVDPLPDDPAEVARRLATGARHHARGSSGVILAGWLTGLAEGLVPCAESPRPPAAPDGPDQVDTGTDRLARALLSAARGARRAVAEPWPGTVLEVAEQVAAEVDPRESLAALLVGPLSRARADLAETSRRHPVLREAGVVDAGACALLVALEVLAALLAGQPVDHVGDWLPDAEPGPHRHGSDGAFEVMLDVTVEVDRARLASTGTAAAVVGTGDDWRTHVHTDDPVGAVALVPPDALRVGLVRAVLGDRSGPVVVTDDVHLAAWYAAAGAAVVVPGGAAGRADLAETVAALKRGCVLATDPRLADLVGALTGDPVRAAVACVAVDEGLVTPERAVRGVRTVETDDPDPTGALAGLPGGEVLTAVPRVGVDTAVVRSLAEARGLDLVLVGAAGSGPAWRLGVE